MKKKKVVKEKKVKDDKEIFVPKQEVISTLELNLGRDDLNAVVGKLNEVINKVNKCQ